MREELYELPKGWVWASLKECSFRITDGTHQSPKFTDEGVPFIFVTHIVKGAISFEQTKFISESTYHQLNSRCPVEIGDILYSAVGSYGVAVPVNTNRKFSFQRHIAHIKPVSEISQLYLVNCLNSPICVQQAHKTARGVAQKTVALGDLSKFIIPIAPLPEQHRIVAKIEELFTQLDAGVELLKKVKAKLKRYRQAVLKAAVEGNLTKEWREANQGELEPASVLLERILKQRREKWEAEQLAKMKAQGKTPKDDSWKLKYKEAIAPDTSDLCELPDGWCWVRLDTIAALKGGITKDSKRKFDNFRKIPYLRVANVQRGYLDLSEIKEIEATERIISELLLQKNDILFNEGGDRDKLGRGWIWQEEISECIHQNHVFRGRLYYSDISAKFVSWCSNSYGAIYFMKEGKQTTNLASINLSKLSAFPIPLPPQEEQVQIQCEVERSFSVIDQLEKTINASLKRAEKLRQTILKQAFEGKLVPQDPNDEPAEKLLERIKAEKAKQVTTKTKKKTKSQPQSPAQLALPLE